MATLMLPAEESIRTSGTEVAVALARRGQDEGKSGDREPDGSHLLGQGLTEREPSSATASFAPSRIVVHEPDLNSAGTAAWYIPVNVAPYVAPLREHPSAKPLITDRVRIALYQYLLPFIDAVAREHFVKVLRLDVFGFTDPEEGSQEIVVIQLVHLHSDHALRYWDQLSWAMGNWILSVPNPFRSIVDDRISVEVRWIDDDRAI
jgi:hypothetical protein